MPKKTEKHKKKTKAEKKKLKKASQSVFCWYCEREFEDAKVLLQHQKAKHFRCTHCPRRLNTAGGLAVHIDQVHKLPTERIENAMPGRDTFDVEIYGMEGVPANDLADWKRRKAESLGLDPDADKRKRPRIFLGVISPEELKAQLEQHRALMSGAQLPSAQPAPAPYGVPPPGMMPPGVPPPGMFPPPAGMPMPPPGFPALPPGSMPPGMPFPPPGMSMPPLPPGMSLPPGIPFPPPPGVFPPGMLPPPGFIPPPGSGAAGMPPGMPLPPPGFVPPPGMSLPPPQGMPLAPTSAPMPPAHVPVENSQTVLKTGPGGKPTQVLLYGDNEISMEEKRARQPRYHAPKAIVG